ncbi:MAG TPA: hypothetical protein VGN20_16840 [Mucilaginibacter sp.]|jgi:hypothetical protein
MDIVKEVQSNIEAARLKYKPAKIKTIIVAEAPPNCIDRFFYFENVQTADFLFLGIIEVLYPDLKNQFMNAKQKRSPAKKNKY